MTWLRACLVALVGEPQAPQDASACGRALSLIGHAQARSAVLRKAAQMRAEMGLPADPRLHV